MPGPNQSDWVFQRLDSGKPSLTGKPRYCYGLVHRECMAPKEAVLEKRVKKSGTSGRVYVPRGWVGKKVKVLLLETLDEDKLD